MDNQVYNLFKNKDKKELKNNKGKLFTFEGLDGAGKFTQVELLKNYLEEQGHKVAKFSFPQYENPIGRVISSYLKGEYGDVQSVPYELICIAYGADRIQASREIRNLLNAGFIVLCDRYTYSNIFTAAKMEESKRNDFIKWIEMIEFDEMGVVRPDFNFYLYVDPKISVQRIAERGKRDYQEGKEDIHEKNSQLLFETSKTYLQFANNNSKWSIIDEMNTDGTQKSIEEVSKILIESFSNVLK